MQHKSMFFWFMFFMDHCLDTKHKMLCIFSACQSSFYLQPAVRHWRLSVHPVASTNGRTSSSGASLRPLVGLVDLLLQRNIPMKSAKNAMRLMWWPPSETVEEDQCCGQSQVPELYPAVCLSELPWWTPILSSVCLGRVFVPSWEKRKTRGRKRKKGSKKSRRRSLGGWRKEGVFRRMYDKEREKMDGGEGFRLLTGWGSFVWSLVSGSQDPWPFSALWP